MDGHSTTHIPRLLTEISDPPKKLYKQGTLPYEQTKMVCFVGSRRYSSYGKEVCEHLVKSLAPYDVSIISGLALGIDSIAHETALKHNMHTIAVPGSGLDPSVLYPRSHKRLAEEIVHSGGALLSEFEPTFKATAWSFPKRNRIMAGLSHMVVIIEAEKKSGTLITARLATEYNRDVAAVPGPIFSQNSEGPHHLIRNGAIPITSSSDLIDALNFETAQEEQTLFTLDDLSPAEKKIVSALSHEPLSRSELIETTQLHSSECGITLSQLELKGIIEESLGKIHLKK